MTDEAVLLEIQTILRSVFELNSLKIDMGSSAANIPEWDSLNHATAIAKIQKHFDVKFSLFDVLKLKTVADIVSLVQQSAQAKD